VYLLVSPYRVFDTFLGANMCGQTLTTPRANRVQNNDILEIRSRESTYAMAIHLPCANVDTRVALLMAQHQKYWLDSLGRTFKIPNVKRAEWIGLWTITAVDNETVTISRSSCPTKGQCKGCCERTYKRDDKVHVSNRRKHHTIEMIITSSLKVIDNQDKHCNGARKKRRRDHMEYMRKSARGRNGFNWRKGCCQGRDSTRWTKEETESLNSLTRSTPPPRKGDRGFATYWDIIAIKLRTWEHNANSHRTPAATYKKWLRCRK